MAGKRIAWALLGAAALSATPAAAADVEFNAYCTIGDFKVCSSVHIFASSDFKTITLRLWNLEQNDSYTDPYGQASTFTAIGLYHSDPRFAFTGNVTLGSVLYNGTDVTDLWGGSGNDIGTLAGVQLELASSTDKGHKGGIVGCTDLGGPQHLSTCGSFPGSPFVEFTFHTDQAFSLQSLEYRLHAQQIGLKADGTKGDFSVKCDTGTTTQEYPGCFPTEVVPEPITTLLLGSGLVGVAGAGLRRRRNGPDVVDG